MKKEALIWIFLLFSISLASSAVVITTQPNQVYNIGDTITIPINIVAETEINNFFLVKLNCPNKITEITKYPLFLVIGEQKQDTISIPFKKPFIGNSSGQCKMDFVIENLEQKSTNLFTLSNLIVITFTSETQEVKPKETVYISGNAVKENSGKVNGIAELTLSDPGIPEEIKVQSEIVESKFVLNLSFSEKTKAGAHYAKIRAYEKDGREISNLGEMSYKINVAQVPTTIEVTLTSNEFDPGTEFKFTPVLKDQTGEKINSPLTITIKNERKKEVFKNKKISGEEIIYSLGPQEKPGTWTITVQDETLSQDAKITIKEKELIETQIVNDTLIVTNAGNVPYTKSLEVMIGTEKKVVLLNLDPGETKKYYLTAPDGNYDVQVGDTKTNIPLTGKIIDVQTSSENLISSVNTPIIWIIIIFAILIIVFLILRRKMKSNFGVISQKKFISKNPHHAESITSHVSTIDKKTLKENELNQRNKAEISLSLNGEKQKSTLVCLKIKNYQEISFQKGSPLETIQKTINLIESKKAYTYDNQENLIFIFAPIKTKTFDNEKYGLDAADKINELLKAHNRNYKQKINYGISVDNVDLIVRLDHKGMVFMPLGSSMPALKRMSTSAQDEIVLSENIKQKVATSVKVERRPGMDGYIVTGVRDNQGNNKMLSDLKKRIGEN